MFIMNFKEIHSTRNFFRRIVEQGFALAEIESKTIFIEKWLERNVQATLALAFCSGGNTRVQHPLANTEIYLTFSKVLQRVEICNWTFYTL